MLENRDWVEINFGQVVENANSHEKAPLENGINRYISLEHIDSGSFKIRRWGDLVSEKTSFTKVFRQGDTLFGKRRSYLKKVARAEFDGICSSDILVFRPKNGLLNDLIPFIVSSNKFIKYAVSTSAGSLSPRTKWKDLAKLRFRLPAKSEYQKAILELFKSLEKQIECLEGQENALLLTKRKMLKDLFSDEHNFGGYLTAKDYITISFGDISENISKRVDPTQTELNIYVGLEHLDTNNLRIERHGIPEDVKGSKFYISKGDIIFGKRRAYQRKVAVSDFEGICSAHSMVLRAKEKNIKKNFLPYFMQSDTFMDRAMQISEGSLSPTIKWKELKKQEFIIPKKEYQEKLCDLFMEFDHLVYLLRDSKDNFKNLKQLLLDQIFFGEGIE